MERFRQLISDTYLVAATLDDCKCVVMPQRLTDTMYGTQIYSIIEEQLGNASFFYGSNEISTQTV